MDKTKNVLKVITLVYSMSNLPEYPDNTQSLSAKERIALVESDKIRKSGQIAIALVLIGFALVFLGLYAFFKADDAFLSYLAVGMASLVFAGIGAAFAIFGLGRTVGRTPPTASLASSSSGQYARDNDVKNFTARVNYLKEELKNSIEEKSKVEAMQMNPDFKVLYLNLLDREISKTKRELAEAERQLQEMMNSPFYHN